MSTRAAKFRHIRGRLSKQHLKGRKPPHKTYKKSLGSKGIAKIGCPKGSIYSNIT